MFKLDNNSKNDKKNSIHTRLTWISNVYSDY